MTRISLQPRLSLAAHLRSLVYSNEVLRLIYDLTNCQVEWEETVSTHPPEPAKGLELFPCFNLRFLKGTLEVRGVIYPNLAGQGGNSLSHLIRLNLGGLIFDLRLRTPQASFLLSPFHIRFLSMLFGRLLLHYPALSSNAEGGLPIFSPFSLEEQVVAGYLQSLEWVPCATIKLDAQDNPYIGSMLSSATALRRCEFPDSLREEAIIRAWRLFKRLLYYSIEGGRLYTGFAIMPSTRPLEYYRQRWPSLLLYQDAHQPSLEEGIQALRQFLLNADGRNTFLALHRGRIIGLLRLTQGSHRQLASVQSWRSVLPLATISSRGWVSFWVPLKGRRHPFIPLSLLEYRHGHLHIPLFQDIFWQQVERQVQEVCPYCQHPHTHAAPENLAAEVAPERPRRYLHPRLEPGPTGGPRGAPGEPGAPDPARAPGGLLAAAPGGAGQVRRRLDLQRPAGGGAVPAPVSRPAPPSCLQTGTTWAAACATRRPGNSRPTPPTSSGWPSPRTATSPSTARASSSAGCIDNKLI